MSSIPPKRTSSPTKQPPSPTKQPASPSKQPGLQRSKSTASIRQQPPAAPFGGNVPDFNKPLPYTPKNLADETKKTSKTATFKNLFGGGKSKQEDDTKSLFSGGRKASGASIASFKTLPVPGGGFSSRSYKSLMPGGLKDRFSKHGGEPSGTSTLPSKRSERSERGVIPSFAAPVPSPSKRETYKSIPVTSKSSPTTSPTTSTFPKLPSSSPPPHFGIETPRRPVSPVKEDPFQEGVTTGGAHEATSPDTPMHGTGDSPEGSKSKGSGASTVIPANDPMDIVVKKEKIKKIGNSDDSDWGSDEDLFDSDTFEGSEDDAEDGEGPEFPYDIDALEQFGNYQKLGHTAKLYAFLSYQARRFFLDGYYQRSWDTARWLYLQPDLPRYARISIMHLLAHLMPSNMPAFMDEAEEVCMEAEALDDSEAATRFIAKMRNMTHTIRDTFEQYSDGSRDVVPSLLHNLDDEQPDPDRDSIMESIEKPLPIQLKIGGYDEMLRKKTAGTFTAAPTPEYSTGAPSDLGMTDAESVKSVKAKDVEMAEMSAGEATTTGYPTPSHSRLVKVEPHSDSEESQL